MSVNTLHNALENQEENNMETATEEAEVTGAISAPSSPCVSRKTSQALKVDSKIPRPSTLPSPTPLRRSGSLRVRGEKLGFTQTRVSPGRSGHGNIHLIPRSPGATFPSITEGCESWKKSLRGAGDGSLNSALRSQHHHRSLQSLSSRTTSRDSYPLTPTTSPEDLDHIRPQNLNRYLLDHAREFQCDDDDLDSLRSYGSNCSTQSACDHAQFARNGTTFSGKRMKYIVHCSSHPEPNQYLTPTQRANQQIRRLKALVDQARKDLETKDESIFRLTKEVVELRLLRDEVDVVPTKAPGNVEELPALKVASHVDNECGNSTSLSDSGHFDDVLSLTSPHSAQSQSPRQLVLTPDSDRLAETYQRRIDDMNRKQCEKNLEDRKSLVDTYERKMEDMSKRYSEKYQKEKNDLVEMYEKKIEQITKRHLEKVRGNIVSAQEISDKKIQTLSQNEQNKISTPPLEHEKTIQDLSRKLEELQHMLKLTQENEMVLNQQLNDANMRCSELQQELFQSQEKTVDLEEEVETLQKTVALQEVQNSETQNLSVQNAQLVSELQILRRHVDDQKDLSEIKCQIESDLTRVISTLKEKEEEESKELEQEKQEMHERYKEKCQQTLDLQSKLDSEVTKLMACLKEKEEKNRLLEEQKKEAEEACNRALEMKSQIESELTKVRSLLMDSEQKNEMWENEMSALKSSMEEESKKYLALMSQLKDEVADLKNSLHAEKMRGNELDHWKREAQNLKEEVFKQAEEIQNVKEHSDHLEKTVSELKNHLSEERELFHVIEDENSKIKILEEKLQKYHKAKEDENSKIRDFEEKLEQQRFMTEEHLQHVQLLKGRLADVESEAKTYSNLLAEEKQKNQELCEWQVNALELEKVMLGLKEEICEKSQQLQYLSSIESEANKLRDALTLEKQTNQELLMWKLKAEELAEEIKSLKEDIAIQNQELQQVKEHAEKVDDESRDLKSLLENLEHVPHLTFSMPETNTVSSYETYGQKSVTQNTPDKSQQDIMQLKAEIEELKESLDQSYWVQSEKETLKLESEKKIQEQALQLQEQALQLQKQESEIHSLNQCISELKRENEILISYKMKRVDPIEEPILNETNVNNFEQCAVSNLNGKESGEAAKDIISELKKEIESLRKALNDQEERHTEMNLKMYLKGQEAAKFERKDQVLEMAVQAPEKVSVPELLSQLAETEKELEKVKAMYRQLAEGQANSSSSPEATLLFLKSAFYYFLTDEANCQGHLNAIQSILGFTESEKQAVDTLTYIRR